MADSLYQILEIPTKLHPFDKENLMNIFFVNILLIADIKYMI